VIHVTGRGTVQPVHGADPAGGISGENREIIVKSPDLCGLMDRLDDLFTAPANPD
jgi:hypothetical protein